VMIRRVHWKNWKHVWPFGRHMLTLLALIGMLTA
jgi:hypothetical protein